MVIRGDNLLFLISNYELLEFCTLVLMSRRPAWSPAEQACCASCFHEKGEKSKFWWKFKKNIRFFCAMSKKRIIFAI